MRVPGVALLLLTFITGVGASAIRPATFTIAIPYPNAWRNGNYVMELDVHVDSATLRYRATDGTVHTIRSGMLVPVADRPIKRGVPTIALPADALATAPLQLALTSEVDHPAIRILTLDALMREDAAQREHLDFPLLLFAGLFLALALANLTLFASFRDDAHVWYAGVMISVAWIALRSSPQLFWAWLFPHLSVPHLVVYDSSILAYSICVIAFTRSFLSTRKTIPQYDRFLVSMYFVFVAVEVTAHYGLSSVRFGGIELVDALYIAFLLVPYIGGILALRAGSPAARFYLIATGGVYVSLVIMDTLAFFGHTYPLIVFFGLAWEGLWLIAALGDRVRRLDKAALDLAQEQAAAALHDPLTGLANRRKIEMDLRETPPPFALVYLDVDHFSLINATAGHDAGDHILAGLTDRLDRFVRAGDTLARISSDEFAFLLRHRTLHGAQQVAYDTVAEIAGEPFVRDRQTFSITASAGCLFVNKRSSPSMLLAMAADASACAKEHGRNRVYFATDDAAEETTRDAMQWARRTSAALRDDRLALFYQLIVPLRERADGARVEILVRLIDEDGSIIESPRFLPAADRFSLTASIDRWVISHALPIAAPLVDAGTLMSVSINLSGNALQDPGLAEFILSEIRASGIRPSALTFEITETVVLSMLGQVRLLMSALRRYDVCFALDDFGTGTSSLGVLRQLDVDFLKIDGAFVRDCATNAVDAAMLKTIQDLAGALGLKTIAEYAKDSAIVEKLREIGIDYAQGWAYAKPEPIRTLADVPTLHPFDLALPQA